MTEQSSLMAKPLNSHHLATPPLTAGKPPSPAMRAAVASAASNLPTAWATASPAKQEQAAASKPPTAPQAGASSQRPLYDRLVAPRPKSGTKSGPNSVRASSRRTTSSLNSQAPPSNRPSTTGNPAASTNSLSLNALRSTSSNGSTARLDSRNSIGSTASSGRQQQRPARPMVYPASAVAEARTPELVECESPVSPLIAAQPHLITCGVLPHTPLHPLLFQNVNAGGGATIY